MLIKFMVQSGIVVGAIYYSRQAGVWGDSKQTEVIYNNVSDQLRPHIKNLQKKLPFDVPAMPQTDESGFLVKHYYNQGVKEVFYFLEMMPCYTGQLMKKAKTAIDEFMQSPPTSSDSKTSGGKK